MSIARTVFAAGYADWLFDLSNDIGAKNCFDIPRTESVCLELKFSKATTATINVICYAEDDAVMEIDKHRNVIACGREIAKILKELLKTNNSNEILNANKTKENLNANKINEILDGNNE